MNDVVVPSAGPGFNLYPKHSTVKTCFDVSDFNGKTVPAGTTWVVTVVHEGARGYTLQAFLPGQLSEANVQHSVVTLVQRAMTLGAVTFDRSMDEVEQESVEEEPPLHFYALSFGFMELGSASAGQVTLDCIYRGYTDQKITRARIEEARRASAVGRGCILQSVCYLGYMTVADFEDE